MAAREFAGEILSIRESSISLSAAGVAGIAAYDDNKMQRVSAASARLCLSLSHCFSISHSPSLSFSPLSAASRSDN